MYNLIKRCASGNSAIVLMLTIVAACAIFSSIISMGVLYLMGSDYTSIATMRVLQIVQSIGIFIAPSIIGTYIFYNGSYKYCFGERKNTTLPIVILSVLIITSSTPLISWATHVNMNLSLPESMSNMWEWMKTKEGDALEMTRQFLAGTKPTDLIINAFIMAILPAIGEEWLFRGMLQPLTARLTKNMDLAIILTAIMFSALHFQFVTFLPRVILGVILGYLFYLGGSLWLSIAAHFANNFIAFAAYAYYQLKLSDTMEDPLSTEGVTPELFSTLFSLVVVSMGLYAIYLSRLKREIT